MTNQEYLPYYKGQASSIVVVANEGVKVEFPAMHLRVFLTTSGIKGYFCLQTKDNKFLSLKKISN